jgi:hypothetical protein
MPMWNCIPFGPDIVISGTRISSTDRTSATPVRPCAIGRVEGQPEIFINLDGSGYLWAGSGPPPLNADTGSPREVFFHDDPKGRPEGALVLAHRIKASQIEQDSLQRRQREEWIRIKLGGDVRRRKERIGITLEDLALRLDVDPSWVRDVESGRTSMQLDHASWVDIVWATREPWPDPRRTQSGQNGTTVRPFGWVDEGGGGLLRAEESVRRWLEATDY